MKKRAETVDKLVALPDFMNQVPGQIPALDYLHRFSGQF
jgi:hypothetical protein